MSMKKIVLALLVCVLWACGEKMVKEPDNLIPKEKMSEILFDLAILNAGKNTNPSILTKNKIEIMENLYTKYKIDSTQFVTSDTYYASIPAEYEDIYNSVEKRLDKLKKSIDEAKKKEMDSVRKKNVPPSTIKERATLKKADSTGALP